MFGISATLPSIAQQSNPYRRAIPEKSAMTNSRSKVGEASPLPSLARHDINKNPIWKPGTAIRTNWNGMEWKDYARYTFTYDAAGRTLTERAENLDKTQTQYYTYSLIEYTYDDLGRLAKSDVKAGFTPDNMVLVSTTETYYDEIRPDVVVEQNSYDVFSDGTKELNADSYKQIIERNDDGNITAMYAFTWYEGDFIEVQSLETTYGTDGAPSSMVESVLTQETEGGPLEVKPAETYSDCKWDKFDGQIISLDEITGNDNRLIQANVSTTDQADIKMTVEYPGDQFDFISTSEYSYLTLFPTKTVMSHKDLGNGGFYTKTVTDQDLTSAGAYPVQSIDQILHQYDAYGNLIEAQNQTFYGHTIINSWEKGTVESDARTGLPIIYTRLKYQLQEGNDYYGDWENSYRITYGDWNDAAGVEEVANDCSDGIVELFNLSGIKVNDPAPGVYIRKQGENIQKVIIQ